MRTAKNAPDFRVQVSAAGDPTFFIYDDIGPEWLGMVSAETITAELAIVTGAKRINVRINSPGGDVFEGFAIYNAFCRCGSEIIVEVDGLAASAASLVAMAGDKIRMAANSMMMIHNAWTVIQGNKDQLRKMASTLSQIDGNLVQTYAARTGLPASKIKNLLDAETWMTATEAFADGFADQIGQPLLVGAKVAKVAAGRYRNTPARFLQGERSSALNTIDRWPKIDLQFRLNEARREWGLNGNRSGESAWSRKLSSAVARRRKELWWEEISEQYHDALDMLNMANDEPRSADKQRRTAIHEAGHLLMACECAVDIHGAHIIPSDGRAGAVQANFGDPRLTKAEQVAISVAGGMAAEMSRGGTFDPNSYGNCSDLRSVRRLFRPFQKLEEAPEYQEGLQLAGRILREKWHKVEALANALLRRRQLSSEEIYNILQPSGNRFGGF